MKYYFLYAWTGGGWLASKYFDTVEEAIKERDKKSSNGLTVGSIETIGDKQPKIY